MNELTALLRGIARENDARDEARAERSCSLGVGCGTAGVCYAKAHGRPEECPCDGPRFDVLSRSTVKVGGFYNWHGQPDRLVYLGRNWSGNGYWHQFKKIGDPRPVWGEYTDADLAEMEETRGDA